jgi:hypothetical protein
MLPVFLIAEKKTHGIAALPIYEIKYYNFVHLLHKLQFFENQKTNLNKLLL